MSPLSSKKKCKVFEFNEDDERVEKASKKILRKFAISRKNQRQSSSSTMDKYTFLQCFTQGAKSQGVGINQEPIDIDDKVALREQKDTIEELLDVNDSGIPSENSNYFSYAMSIQKEENSVGECAFSDHFSFSTSISYKNEQVDGVLDDDDDDCVMMSSLTTPSSPPSVNEVLLLENVAECASEHETDIETRMVTVVPDFIVYGDNNYTKSQITFSCSLVSVEGSIINGTKGTFRFEWTIGDIINIQSGSFGSVETAIVTFVLTSKDSTRARNGNNIPGIELLKFAICDQHWSEMLEAIMSLDERYKERWVIVDYDSKHGENTFLSQRSRLPSRRASLVFDEPFEECVYPKGHSDAILISKRDMELLKPEMFINDTIIDFYIKYLNNKMQPEKQQHFHFFNSFFFRKLADLDKDPSKACEGRAAFRCVRKWTRKLNIFEKDYIFIPVNYSLHWSLIVICHPGEVAYFRDNENEKSLKVPCILHMDSIRGSHRGLTNLIQRYLCAEWKERRSIADDEVASKFLRVPFLSLELPQQQNSYDCGLFLLHYVERFLQEAPTHFNPSKITQVSNFLNRNWFPPAEVSVKRAQIKKLLYEIFEDYSAREDPSAECIDKYSSSQLTTNDGKETGAMYLGKIWSPLLMGQEGCTLAEKGIDISILGASPHRGLQHTRGPEFIFREQCMLATSPRSFAYRSYQHSTASFQKKIMSPIKEAGETGVEMATSPCDAEHVHHVTEWTTESRRTSNYRDLQKTSCDKQLQLHFELLNEDNSMKRCHISSEVEGEVDKDQPLAEHDGLDYQNITDEPKSSSCSIDEFSAIIVEDSDEKTSEMLTLVVEDSDEETGGTAALVVEDSEDENDT